MSKLFSSMVILAVSTLSLIMMLFLPDLSQAAQVTLTWDPNDPAPDGYCIYSRTESQAYDYSQPCWTGYGTTGTIDGLKDNTAYYFVVRAFVAIQESADSNEVKFANGTSTPIGMEAEDGDLQWPMTIGDDAAASAGGYVGVPEGTGSVYYPSNGGGVAEYQFEVPATGDYVIWGRQMSSDSASDSVFVSIDGQAEMIWYMKHGDADTWTWDVVSNRAEVDLRDTATPQLYRLEAGFHTLSIKQRDDGIKLDSIVITDDLTLMFSDLCMPLTGDANGDGVVNFADLAIVRADFGQTGEPGWIPADINSDGTVNFADLAIMRTQFGETECVYP